MVFWWCCCDASDGAVGGAVGADGGPRHHYCDMLYDCNDALIICYRRHTCTCARVRNKVERERGRRERERGERERGK